MSGRPHVSAPSLRNGKANRVANRGGGHLVVADQSRNDRKSGGVRGGPSGRTQGIGREYEDRAGARFPTPVGLREGVVELIQYAVVAIEREHMTVAFGLR